MKKILELPTRQTPAAIIDFPDDKTEPIATVCILFISPKTNASGYYRMLLPYQELSKTDGFATHILGMGEEDFNAPFTLGDLPVLDSWILWADYMIFPMLTGDLSYFFKACREINPELQLVMNVDTSLHYMRQNDPLLSKISDSMLEGFETNLNQMDIVSAPNKALLSAYQQVLTLQFDHPQPFFALLPNLISRIGYQDLAKVKNLNSSTTRIGMIGSLRSAQDMILLSPVLEQLQKELGDRLTFVVLGWDGVLQDGSEPLRHITIEYHPSVSFTEYFQKLEDLHLDIALLPQRDTAYARFCTDLKYLELAAQGIAVIASKRSVYKQCIIEGKTGLLADTPKQWISCIKRLYTDRLYWRNLATDAQYHVWQHHSYTRENIASFTDVFI
jgi:glycosyltransferase involved in cell wall biosynthesis